MQEYGQNLKCLALLLPCFIRNLPSLHVSRTLNSDGLPILPRVIVMKADTVYFLLIGFYLPLFKNKYTECFVY